MTNLQFNSRLKPTSLNVVFVGHDPHFTYILERLINVSGRRTIDIECDFFLKFRRLKFLNGSTQRGQG